MFLLLLFQFPAELSLPVVGAFFLSPIEAYRVSLLGGCCKNQQNCMIVAPSREQDVLVKSHNHLPRVIFKIIGVCILGPNQFYKLYCMTCSGLGLHLYIH